MNKPIHELAGDLRREGHAMLKAADVLDGAESRSQRPVRATVTNSEPVQKLNISAKGRARIAAAQRARWAKVRAVSKKKAA
jgi:hypothetical protein